MINPEPIEERLNRIDILARAARAAGWIAATVFITIGEVIAASEEPFRDFEVRVALSLALLAAGQLAGWLLDRHGRRIIRQSRLR